MKLFACFHGQASIVCSGDVFDRWNAPPEIINLALESLPVCYAVPGQHDLPLHSYRDRKKSAYWTLVEAGKIKDLVPFADGGPRLGYVCPYNVNLHGFPWGFDLCEAPEDKDLNPMHVAVVHRYCWKDGHTHPGAKPEDHVNAHRGSLEGFQVALFGDNHRGFASVAKPGHPHVINGGTFLKRKSDERDYKPFLGLVYADGTIGQHFLDTSKDEWSEVFQSSTSPENRLEAEQFLEELGALNDQSFDFKEAVVHGSKRMKPEVRAIILQALEAAEGK